MVTEMPIAIAAVPAEAAADHLPGLGALLHACVLDGASVGFVLPFSRADAAAFWRDRVLPAMHTGGRLLLIAHHEDTIVGTVQLHHDTMPNQPHRAEISKLLVHPDYRRRAIARRLMTAVEPAAVGLGRRLITLDTRTGDTAAALYTALGYRTVGEIPGYCLNPFEDRLESTTIMYKTL